MTQQEPKVGHHSTHQPLVSVIMAAYNASVFIAQAIDSVMKQTYPNWELLIINDGSKDNTEEVVSKFKDSRIRYFKQENKGVSSARNVGLDNMRGEMFCMLDSDDVLPEKSLELRVQKFMESEEVEFVDGIVVLKDKDLKKTIKVKEHSFQGNPFKALLHLDDRCFFGPSWMIKRVPDKNYRFKDGMTHGEELMLYITLAHTGIYTAVKEPILFYRVSGTSAMSNLKGLENGYVELYGTVKTMPAVSFSDKLYLKGRIIRIMFLSYLRRGQYSAAFRVVFRYLGL